MSPQSPNNPLPPARLGLLKVAKPPNGEPFSSIAAFVNLIGALLLSSMQCSLLLQGQNNAQLKVPRSTCKLVAVFLAADYKPVSQMVLSESHFLGEALRQVWGQPKGSRVYSIFSPFIRRLGSYNHQAAMLNLGFIGTSVLTPVFMGWLADEYFGRNKLMYIALSLHFLGTALLSMLAFPAENFYRGAYPVFNNTSVEEQAGLFHVALLTLCLGTGGIRAVVCPPDMCGSQERESKKPMPFCNWASWSANLNAAVVFLGISSIQPLGSGALGILLPSLSVFTALVTLYLKHCDLIYRPENRCSLLTIARAFVRALKTRCLPYCHFGRDGSSWLDHAMEKQGGHHSELQEEDTRNISALLPLFSFQILYRTCLLQIPSGYYLQTMNSNRNWGGFSLPIALMNAISLLPLLILPPFMDYFSNCLLPSKRDGPFLSACMIAGNICAASSVAMAGFLEIYRKLAREQSPSGKLFSVSSMACVCLVPQYVLLGVSEVLVNPAGKGTR